MSAKNKKSRNEIIAKLKDKFLIKELVCQHTLAKHGEKSWQFLNTELLETLMVLRFEIFNVPMHINSSSAFQRGLRCNICPEIKKYTDKNQSFLSAHSTGSGVDVDFDGYSAEEARQHIKNNANKLPYPIRLEKNVTWVHIDIYNDLSGNKIVEFVG